MKKVVLIDPLAKGKGFLGHRHLLRDWSGAYTTGFISFPPLDLMYAASFLRGHGHEVKIIEASVKHLSHKKVAQTVGNLRADYALIPSTYFSLEEDKMLAGLIRKASPGIKIIFSGPYVTFEPHLVLADHSADFVALGELELPLLGIMNEDFSSNVAYNTREGIVIEKRELLDLNELLAPARDLIENSAYRYAIFNRNNPVTATTISRGCPHSKCKFCHANLYTLGEIRYRPIASIRRELDEITFKYHSGEIFFRDQTFTANKELVMAVCEYMIARKMMIPWRATTRVDLVDIELLKRMKAAGCYQLSFGFESCSQDILDLNEKGITIEQSYKATEMCKEAGIEIMGLFMFGMIGDTPRTLRDLTKFIVNLQVDYVQIDGVYFIPGTPLFEKYKRSDLLPPSIITRHMLAAYTRFYLRPRYLTKLFRKVTSMSDLVFLLRTGFDAFFSYI